MFHKELKETASNIALINYTTNADSIDKSVVLLAKTAKEYESSSGNCLGNLFVRIVTGLIVLPLSLLTKSSDIKNEIFIISAFSPFEILSGFSKFNLSLMLSKP